MKFINMLLVLMIVVVYTLAFVMRVPAQGFTLAPNFPDETEAETEVKETEIKEDKAETDETKPYTDDDFYELSHVIQAEAGYCDWDMMVGVGSVVLNRVNSDKFPNTVYEVIHQMYPVVQYSTVSYLDSHVPTDQVLEVTDFLLRNGSQYPADVLYQANSPQGLAIYKTLSTSYSTMYFCYG